MNRKRRRRPKKRNERTNERTKASMYNTHFRKLLYNFLYECHEERRREVFRMCVCWIADICSLSLPLCWHLFFTIFLFFLFLLLVPYSCSWPPIHYLYPLSTVYCCYFYVRSSHSFTFAFIEEKRKKTWWFLTSCWNFATATHKIDSVLPLWSSSVSTYVHGAWA